jgi:inorganic phosphate transporter, PiT family
MQDVAVIAVIAIAFDFVNGFHDAANSIATVVSTTLFFTSYAGIPVSTTHTVTGAIVGVGASRRLSAVRWGVAGRVVWAWIVTIPGAWLIASLTYALVAAFS